MTARHWWTLDKVNWPKLSTSVVFVVTGLFWSNIEGMALVSSLDHFVDIVSFIGYRSVGLGAVLVWRIYLSSHVAFAWVANVSRCC
jgi:hypothetical protein